MTAVPAHLLKGLHLEAIGFREEPFDFHFQVAGPEPKACPTCRKHTLVKFGAEDVGYRDLPYDNHRVTLWVVRQRYRCRSCNYTFRPELPDMDRKRMFTKRLRTFIEKAVLERTNSDVAREVGLDEKTVRLIFDEFCEQREAELTFATPTVLGMDELYLGKEFRAVFTNIKENTVIDMCEDRKKVTVIKFLHKLENRHTVEKVCMDMYSPYREACQLALPQAEVIVDKFHITRMANEAMDEIRKAIKGQLTVHQRRALRGDRRLLLMREADLDEWARLRMETWLNAFPELGAAYKLKEAFYGVWEAKGIEEAKERYEAWQRTIPGPLASFWNELTRAMRNWEKEVFNYFKPGNRFTNAFTESSNRDAKSRQRDARGLSFEVIRAKILYAQKHKIVRSKVRRHSPFGDDYIGFGRYTPNDLAPPLTVAALVNVGVPISTVQDLLDSGAL